jgi:hypothetical protein
LDVELFTLGVSRLAPGAPDAVDPAGPQIELTVSSPDCRSELLLSLHAGERADAHVVRVSELPTLGRERALSLLSVERLQRAWPELAGVELSSAPEPTPVEKTAVSPKPAATGEPGARSRQAVPARTALASASRERAPGQGALSAGLRLSATDPLASLGLSVDHALSRSLALGGALGWRSETMGPSDATDAYSVTLGPRAELALAQLGVFELTTAVGLLAGAAWVVTARAGDAGGRITSSPAPLGLATLALGTRAVVAYDVFVQLGVTVEYALLGARFETSRGRSLADLTGARFGAYVGIGALLGG